MTPQKLGSLIGAVFGLVFVYVNTGSLPTGATITLRVLAVAAFLAVLYAVRRPPRIVSGAPVTAPLPATVGFSRSYWVVVAAEVIAIWAGLALLNGPLDAPDAAVAWIAAVVGAHFFALAVVWRQRLFHWLGAAIAACGAAGLVLAAAGADRAAIDVVGGVLPGVALFAFALYGSTRAVPADAGIRTG